MSSYQHCFGGSIRPIGLWPLAFEAHSVRLSTMDLLPEGRGQLPSIQPALVVWLMLQSFPFLLLRSLPFTPCAERGLKLLHQTTASGGVNESRLQWIRIIHGSASG